MNRIRMAVLTLALLPLGALAQQQNDDAEARELEAEKRLRIARVVGLAEELELDSAQALRLDETLRKFDERRRPLMKQVRESAQILESAAAGDSAALPQVEQAAQRAFDARAQLATLDRETFQSLSKDMPPQKRAKLALFMARFDTKSMKFKLRDEMRMKRDEARQKRDEALQMRKQMRMMRGVENRG
jgi:ATP-dependent Lon protease